MPRGNFSYVIDSSFQPFSMQELLTPFVMYKDEYEKQEAAYNELTDKADKFKYLSETLPEDSKSRAIYEGYANELYQQAADLTQNGLSIGTRRSLTNLKRRYQGEIGRLVSADEAMREQMKLRSAANANGQNILYAENNLNIDQFLDNNTPNLYSINADELRKEGAQYAQAASSRIYGNTQIQNVNKYFQDIIQQQGYSSKVLAAWRQSLERIPEFNQAVNDILEGRQVNGNLTGRNYEIARQNVINGIMEGAVYQEKHNVQQNPGVLTAAQQDASAREWAEQRLRAASEGMISDGNGGYKHDITKDPKYAGTLWMYDVEDGQIKGYSEKYTDMIKDKTIPHNGDPTNNDKNGDKSIKPAPDPKVAYNTNGERKEAKGSQNNPLNYGHKLSKAEALDKYTEAVMTHGDKYNYWEHNGWCYPVPKTEEELRMEQNNEISSIPKSLKRNKQV